VWQSGHTWGHTHGRYASHEQDSRDRNVHVPGTGRDIPMVCVPSVPPQGDILGGQMRDMRDISKCPADRFVALPPPFLLSRRSPSTPLAISCACLVLAVAAA
jgi:hypothetical protein